MQLVGQTISALSSSTFLNELTGMERSSRHYNLLGISKDATPEEIKRAYHEAVLRLHPDVNLNPGDTEHFLNIQNAYEVLSNPNLRTNYDDNPVPGDGVLPVNLQFLNSRSILPKLNEPQLVYALMSLSPTTELTLPGSAALNLCLVLDQSTSMQGPRLDNLKETAISLLHQLNANDNLSIVTFSDRAEVLLPTGARREQWEIESGIYLIQSGGGTEIYQGLSAGLKEVYRLLDTSAINHVILVTDGRTYGDEADCLKLADIAARQGVAITCVGIGNEWNDVFLDKLAARTGGSCMYASDPIEIGSKLREKFHTLSHTYANDVTLQGKIEPGVSLNYAFRLQPETGDLPKELPIPLGNIPRDGSLDILLEFIIEPLREMKSAVTLFDGRINMKLAGSSVSPVSIYANFKQPIGATASPEKPPIAIAKAVERLALYRLQEKAYHELYEGNIEPATHRLEHLANRLLALGEDELSQIILDEVDNLQNGLSISASGKKRIKYGTRALVKSNEEASS